jgi:hypothetical protein
MENKHYRMLITVEAEDLEAAVKEMQVALHDASLNADKLRSEIEEYPE